jgi:3(or 17)beta-hydroxysteroid dehydrogenase
LGLADAELLAAEGATVVLTDINEAAGTAAAERIGKGAVFLRQDVSKEAEWEAVIAETMRRFRRLDILVNNAGVVVVATPEETTLEQFRLANAIMSEGVFLGCKYAIPAMAKSGGGSIINMSSTASHLGYSVFFAYSAAKGAVRAMTKSIAMHCQEQGYGIRCNSIHPASIETPMIQGALGRPGRTLEVPDGVLPAEAIGAPSDVAQMVLYLASNESRFVTGAEFLLDNGLMIRP